MFASSLSNVGASLTPLSAAPRGTTVRSGSSRSILATSSSYSRAIHSKKSVVHTTTSVGNSGFAALSTATGRGPSFFSRASRSVATGAAASAAAAAAGPAAAAATATANAALPQIAAAAISITQLTMANALSTIPYATMWLLSIIPCCLGFINPVYVFSVGYGLSVAAQGGGLWAGERGGRRGKGTPCVQIH